MERLKNEKWNILITALACLIPILIGLYFWDQLPEQIPTHFGPSGEPDSYSPKSFAVYGMPCIMVAGHLFGACITALDPRRRSISDGIYHLILWMIPCLSLFICFMTLGTALDLKIDITKSTMILTGFIFLIVGNILPKCRQNYTVGIKLPWTLDDVENWNKTHRFAGYLFMICGLLIIVNSIIGGSFWVNFVLMMIAVFLPCIYSFLYYIRTKG